MQAISACNGRRQDVLAPFLCQLDLSLPFGKTSGTRRVLRRFAMMATNAILKIWMRHFRL